MGTLLSGGERPESFSLDELTFCHKLPELLELECPICLQVMINDPCLVSCCGHHFCGYCITQAKRSNNACPYCKADNYETMPDKGLERNIKTLRVKCTCNTSGCGWQGELSSLIDHLKKNEREGDCPCAVVECMNKCGHKQERHELGGHEKEVCPKRRYQCSHCGHKATYEAVTDKHYGVCQRYPILCPNGCDSIKHPLERRFMKKHIEKECPLTYIVCDYEKEGCGWKGQRRHFEEHCSKECVKHLRLVNERTKCLEEENKDLKRDVKELNGLVKKAASELRKQSVEIEKLQKHMRELQQCK